MISKRKPEVDFRDESFDLEQFVAGSQQSRVPLAREIN